ncbi:hypothetical protein [Pseudonocardia zijingensis]|jgi:hypothetical protein|uniref:MAPEG family protein n=1 Tax=Pseudonocardia zijingensis TaxID=153376 RepID=A0ABN1PWN5_9PSEU
MASDGPAAAPARRHLLGRFLGWQRRRWSSSRELAHAIHGTVVGAAAMAAASLHGTMQDVVVTVLVTVVVYWAAERYAQVLGAAVSGPQRRARVRAALRQGRPMIESAYTPLAVLLVVGTLTGNLRTGVLSALITATLLLGALGHVAARRAGTSTTGAIGWGAVSASLGMVIILLKLALH